MIPQEFDPNKKTILVLEDKEDFRKLFQDAFDSMPTKLRGEYNLMMFENWEDFKTKVDYIDEENIEVLLLDHNLNHPIDGEQIYQKLLSSKLKSKVIGISNEVQSYLEHTANAMKYTDGKMNFTHFIDELEAEFKQREPQREISLTAR